MSYPTGIKKGVVRAYQVLYEKYIGDFGKEYENCMQSDDNYACTSLAFVETKRLWRRSHKEIASIAGNPDLDVRDLYIHHIRKNKTYAPLSKYVYPDDRSYYHGKSLAVDDILMQSAREYFGSADNQEATYDLFSSIVYETLTADGVRSMVEGAEDLASREVEELRGALKEKNPHSKATTGSWLYFGRNFDTNTNHWYFGDNIDEKAGEVAEKLGDLGAAAIPMLDQLLRHDGYHYQIGSPGDGFLPHEPERVAIAALKAASRLAEKDPELVLPLLPTIVEEMQEGGTLYARSGTDPLKGMYLFTLLDQKPEDESILDDIIATIECYKDASPWVNWAFKRRHSEYRYVDSALDNIKRLKDN